MSSQQPSRWRQALEASTLEPASAPTSSEQVAVPGLTLLAHPEPERVGERAALTELVSGRGAALSRIEPLFAPFAGRPAARPLADPQLSRRPFQLEPGPAGNIVLSPGKAGQALHIVGHGRLTDPLDISAQELDRGVALHVARVALLLHRFDPTPIGGGPEHGLVGASDALRRLRRSIAKVAPLDVPVLLRGETGTGKELVAKALHAASGRRGPLVSVNMASIPPSLAAAELFGAAKGAYTGAGRARRGFFARADGGTLFLDEVGETPPEVQALLLRALESGEIQPVGGEPGQRPDVRVVAATDANLEDAASFRAPLLHRLSGTLLELPPLRRRRGDVGLLLLHFLRRELEACGATQRLEPAAPRQRPWLDAGLLARLAMHGWPGNVRQLRNVARHLAVEYRDVDTLGGHLLDGEGTLRTLLGPLDDGPLDGAADRGRTTHRSPSRRKAHRQPSQIDDEELISTLRAHRWRLQPAARALGISRTSIYALVDRCPSLRRAGELGEDEIRDALERAAGDLEAAVDALRVSKHGLLQRMRELDIQ